MEERERSILCECNVFFFQSDPAYSRFVGVLEEPIGRSEEY